MPFGMVWILNNGKAGVDLFFVISGFIMVWVGPAFAFPVGAGSVRGASKFMTLRLIRLLPIYWAATALKIGLIFLIPDRLLLRGRPDLWTMITSFSLLPLNIPESRNWPVLVVGWTLSFELIFYLMFASALLIGIDPILLAPPILSALALASIWRTSDWPSILAAANPIVLEFVWGMWTARLFTTGRLGLKPWAAVIVLALGAAILGLAPPPNYWLRPMEWGLAASLVLVGALSLEAFARGPVFRALSLVGDASYALYLVHGFVLQGVGLALSKLHLNGLAGLAIGLIASVPAGIAVHVYVERPLTKRLRRLIKDRRTRPGLATGRIAALRSAWPIWLGGRGQSQSDA